jgi:hypothetical protein
VPAIFDDPTDLHPMIEGDKLQCARALLGLLPADELAAAIRPYVPPQNSARELRKAARAEQLQREREDRGQDRLKLHDPAVPLAAGADLAEFPAVGELLDLTPSEASELGTWLQAVATSAIGTGAEVAWSASDDIALGPVTPGPGAWDDDPDDGFDDDDGDTVPEPTPIVPAGAEEQLAAV